MHFFLRAAFPFLMNLKQKKLLLFTNLLALRKAYYRQNLINPIVYLQRNLIRLCCDILLLVTMIAFNLNGRVYQKMQKFAEI